MSEAAKTILLTVALIAVFQIMKEVLGVGVALTVAMTALGFCIGAMWGAGREITESRPTTPPEEKEQ